MRKIVNLIHLLFLSTLSLLFVSCNGQTISVTQNSIKGAGNGSAAVDKIWRSSCYESRGDYYRDYLQVQNTRITSLTVLYRPSDYDSDGIDDVTALTNCEDLIDPQHESSYISMINVKNNFGLWKEIRYYDTYRGLGIHHMYQIVGDKFYILQPDDYNEINTADDLINLQISDLLDPVYYEEVEDFPVYYYALPS